MPHSHSSNNTQTHLHTSIDVSKAQALKQTYSNRINHIEDVQFVTTHPSLNTLDRLQHQMLRMHHYMESLRQQETFQADVAQNLDAMFHQFQQDGITPSLESRWQEWVVELTQGARTYQQPDKVSQWVHHFLPGLMMSRKLPSSEQLRQMVMFWEERNQALKDEMLEASWLQRRLMVTIENVQASQAKL